MKLFLRDHLPLIAVQLLQLGLVLLVYTLDGYRNWRTGLYSIFIAMFVLAVYLAFRYVSHRHYYRRLIQPMLTLEESIVEAGQAPVPAAFEELLKTQYRLYREQLHDGEHRRKEHLTFIHQWVHQMKTPLSVIHLTVQGKQDPEAASIREEAEKLDQGLETVMYAARLEAFEQDFHVERVALRQLADQAIREHKRLFIRNEVYPDNEISSDLLVETDAKWMRFVLNQLLSNAIKYSAGSRQKVTLSAVRKGDSVILEIRDRGVGIPQVDLKRVFRPFYTGENGRVFRESTGMGLYLVSKVCDNLQHRVELESRVGEGTVVRIFI